MKPHVLFVLAAFGLVAGCAGTPGDREPQTTHESPGSMKANESSGSMKARGGDEVRGWLSWRGPQQNGTSLETGLPEHVDPTSPAWSYPVKGRGTPVIANGRVYAMGYQGSGPTLQEMLFCLDEKSGELIWDHRFNDFLSDVIYQRYSIGSPTVDPETGNVVCLTTAGLLNCFTPDGELLWQRCLMTEYGRMTFPNGRTGSPLVDGDLAIVHVATSGWGSQAPGRDRFFAFDKRTGVCVWSSTPGGPPKDGSFSFPVVDWVGGKRVLYAGLAGGNLVAVNVRSGQPLWRFQMSIGGMSSSPVLYKDMVIAIHGKENLDNSKHGRMVAIQTGMEPGPDGPAVLSKTSERWRQHLKSFTSSPVLVGNRVYVTVATGDLDCVDADTGNVLWHDHLAPDQIHASPAWGDGKLYVPMNNGSFYIIRPNDSGPEVVQAVKLAGNCLGAPAICNGRVYVHTTDRLYCFGSGGSEAPPQPPSQHDPAPGEPTQLQVIPADTLALQGGSIQYHVRSLDANGIVVSDNVQGVKFADFPAKGVAIDASGKMTIAKDAQSVGAILKVTAGDLSGSARLRIIKALPAVYDFENVELEPHPREQGVKTGPPPSSWLGARAKWEVREVDGNKVLAKAFVRALFQRTMSFTGHPDMSNYTAQIDIMSDGNRRIMSTGGVVNQRYLFRLKGNYQTLEVVSNDELFKEYVSFRWRPHVWYRLKTRVDMKPDGSAIVRGKVWPRDEAEPKSWTIEATHRNAHKKGAPGIYGFCPQNRFRVYLDNFRVTAND